MTSTAPATFESVFRTSEPARDNFLARLFGMFSEDVVRHWCRRPQTRYEDLGRPFLRAPAEHYGHTMDFTLRDRVTGLTYVSELKCEITWDGYKYLRLVDPGQLDHHQGAAFRKFLDSAQNPNACPVRVGGRPVAVDGAVLVWGATTDEGVQSVRARYGFADVLSVEAMLADLLDWEDAAWQEYIVKLEGWMSRLTSYLHHGGGEAPGTVTASVPPRLAGDVEIAPSPKRS